VVPEDGLESLRRWVERESKVGKKDSDDRVGREDKGEDKGDWAWVWAMKRPRYVSRRVAGAST
jgi:hypothetical protein